MNPIDPISGVSPTGGRTRPTVESDLERQLVDLQTRLLQRIEEANGRFNTAQVLVAQAQHRLMTIEELRAEAQDVLDAARAEAAEIIEQARAERELTALHVDHHVETGRAMAELETVEIVSRTVARAREASQVASQALARLQDEMDRHVEDEVREHEEEIARVYERHRALRSRMVDIIESGPDLTIDPEIDLRDDDPTQSAPEIFETIDGWIADRLS